MDVYETFPEGRAALPPALLLTDAGGLREAMRKMGDRLARGGRHVLVPDLLHRQRPFAPFDMKTVFTIPPERDRLMAIAKSVKTDEAMHDIGACLDHLKGLSNVKGGALLVGYCMGGRIAFCAADRFGDRVAAAASIHGGGLVTPKGDSPHRHVSGIRASLYFGVADEDPTCTPENVIELEAELKGARIDYTLERYAGRKHGWAVTDTDVHDEAGAEQQWQRVESLFDAAVARAG
jgi:carboxymethylenebutenolidase